MDKLLHLMVGIIIGMVVTLCTGSVVLGIAVALAAGLIKEIFDVSNSDNGEFSFWDMFATLLGGLIGAGFVWLCYVVQ